MKLHLSEMNLSRDQQIIAVTVAVGLIALVSVILVAVRCCKASRPKRIVLCGLPNAGKTKLYTYLMT